LALGYAASVDEGYLETLGLGIVAGRGFGEQDRSGDTVLINEELARRFWPEGNAVGRTIELGDTVRAGTFRTFDNPEFSKKTVAGVVRESQIAEPEPDNEAVVFRYVRAEENLPAESFSVVVPDAVAPAVQEAIRRAAPEANVSAAAVTDRLGDFTAGNQILTRFAGALGTLALVLASIGIYGVFSFNVEQRRKEIGIRMALGARAGQVVAILVRRNGWALAAGLAAGWLLAIGALAVLRSELFGVGLVDPIAWASVLALLAIAGAAAVAVPAGRAVRVDPVRTLREE
jgi:putative ABC transport system permease protein